MTAVAPFDGGPGRDPGGARALFWIVGSAAAAAAHAAAVALALRAPQPEPPAPEPAPVVMLELAPEAAAPPSPQTYLADRLDQPEEMVETEMPPPIDLPPPVEPPPDVETPVADALPEIEPLPDLPQSDVAVPRPAPRPEVRKVEREPEKQEEKKVEQKRPQSQASSVAAPEKAETAKAPETASARGSSATPAQWQARLMAHLERRKRFPAAARARGEEGTVQVRFSIDDRGNVLSAKVVRSSGHAALDEAVLELMRRASPVPAPPPEASRTITAPVLFNIR